MKIYGSCCCSIFLRFLRFLELRGVRGQMGSSQWNLSFMSVSQKHTPQKHRKTVSISTLQSLGTRVVNKAQLLPQNALKCKDSEECDQMLELKSSMCQTPNLNPNLTRTTSSTTENNHRLS